MSAAACSSPLTYYSGIDAATLGSAGLKSALHDLIDEHTVVSYNDAWEALADLDAAPSDVGKVIGIYSTHLHDAVDDQGISTGWNREHSWPKSFGIEFSGPDYSDLMALYAADWNVNSARSNLYFDNCPTSDGCTSPAHPEAEATTAKDSNRFQPPSDKRGDLARSMFYMAVRYDGVDQSTTDLELAEVADTATFTMGVLSTLLAWHDADPVSSEEAARNQRICTEYQHNRNPFIDHQEWASCIFEDGGACANAPPYPPFPPPVPPSPPPSPSSPPTSCLMLTGILEDAGLSGGTPKAAELFATCDIAELSVYGMGKASNGGGMSSQTLTFAAGALAAGSFFYASYEATEFETYFGHPPNATGGALNVNGDDAIALFQDGVIVDTFGDPDVDGTGEVWEYTSGWAYRISRTVASGVFSPSHWTFANRALVSGCEDRLAETCTNPFPIGTFVPPYSPPSPPPPAPPTPPAASPQTTISPDSPPSTPPSAPAVTMVLVAAGTVSDYTPTVQAEIAAKVATEVGVATSAVELLVEAASVRLSFTITFASEAAATSAASTLDSKLSDTAAAGELLSTTSYTVTVESIETPPTVVLAPAANDSTLPVGAIVGAAAAAAAVALCGLAVIFNMIFYRKANASARSSGSTTTMTATPNASSKAGAETRDIELEGA